MAKYNGRYGKQIGKGLFSTVFKKDAEDFVTIITDDRIKECMAYFGLGGSDLFPSVERLDDPDNWSDLKAYRMEYFPKVSSLKNSLDADQWELYLKLREIAAFVRCNADPKYDYKNFDKYHELFSKIPVYGEQLQMALNNLADYGDDMRFEISPRNVAVKNGKLILLDCWFFISQLREKRKI